MTPAVKRTVEGAIYYYYAKLVVAPAAGREGDYGFIVERYRDFMSGRKRMSACKGEMYQLAALSGYGVCNICGATGKRLKKVPIVPSTLGGPTAPRNTAKVCAKCARSKGDRDLVRWWRCQTVEGKPGQCRGVKYLPKPLMGLYLKLALRIHRKNGTLDEKAEELEDIYGVIRQSL